MSTILEYTCYWWKTVLCIIMDSAIVAYGLVSYFLFNIKNIYSYLCIIGILIGSIILSIGIISADYMRRLKHRPSNLLIVKVGSDNVDSAFFDEKYADRMKHFQYSPPIVDEADRDNSGRSAFVNDGSS